MEPIESHSSGIPKSMKELTNFRWGSRSTCTGARSLDNNTLLNGKDINRLIVKRVHDYE